MATITKTIKPSGGDYTSLSAWEAGRNANLITSGNIEVAECYAMSDTTAVVIDGWTTDAADYIKIYTPTSERHVGVWNTSKYRLEVTGLVGSAAIINKESFVRIDGLQVSASQSSSSADVISTWSVDADNCELQFSNNILKGVSNTFGSGVYAYTGAHTGKVKIWNNIIYDLTTATGFGIYCSFNASSANFYVYNNTVKNCGYGIYNQNATTPAKAYNTLISGCTTAGSGTWVAGTGYNATNNASMAYTVTGGATADRTSQTFSFVGASDFHLTSGDAGARDYGIDLSADANLAFSTDIDAQTRSGSWDIGADEYIATGVIIPSFGYVFG